MIYVTTKEAVSYNQPSKMPKYSAMLFRRAEKLIRHSAKQGIMLNAYIADNPADLISGSIFLNRLKVVGKKYEEMLDRVSCINYLPRVKVYELYFDSPLVITIIPLPLIPEELMKEIKFRYHSTVKVSYKSLKSKIEALRLTGSRVSLVRLRLSSAPHPPGFNLRIRTRSKSSNIVLCTHLPQVAFPDANAINTFLRDAIGDTVNVT
ncbi:MAG: hypothetical protein WCO98_02110 [bacterium]